MLPAEAGARHPLGQGPPAHLPGEDEAADFYLCLDGRWAGAGLRSMKFQILQSRAMRSRHNLFVLELANTIWALARTSTAAFGGRRFLPAGAQFLSGPAAYQQDGACIAGDYIMLQLRLSSAFLRALKLEMGPELHKSKWPSCKRCAATALLPLTAMCFASAAGHAAAEQHRANFEKPRALQQGPCLKMKCHASCVPQLSSGARAHGGRLFQPFTRGIGRIRQACQGSMHKLHGPLHAPHQHIGKARDIHRDTAAGAGLHQAERTGRQVCRTDAVMVEQMVGQRNVRVFKQGVGAARHKAGGLSTSTTAGVCGASKRST